MERRDQVLMYSGGMDSLIAWEFLGRPHRVYCDLGHRYAEQEQGSLDDGHPITVDCTVSLAEQEQSDATIPARNLYLALVGARYADRVWLVVQKDEKSVPDRSRDFLVQASLMLSNLLDRRIVVDTPFPDKDKVDMVGWWLAEGHDEERLRRAWTCYTPGRSGECGACPACLRKFIALDLQGVETQGIFEVDPRTTPTAERYVLRARNGGMSPDRAKRTLLALRPELARE